MAGGGLLQVDPRQRSERERQLDQIRDPATRRRLRRQLDPPQEDVDLGGLLQNAALGTMAIPILGDAIGLLADAEMFITEPETRTPLNAGLSLLGLAPFVPSRLPTLTRQGPRGVGLIGDDGLTIKSALEDTKATTRLGSEVVDEFRDLFSDFSRSPAGQRARQQGFRIPALSGVPFEFGAFDPARRGSSTGANNTQLGFFAAPVNQADTTPGFFAEGAAYTLDSEAIDTISNAGAFDIGRSFVRREFSDLSESNQRVMSALVDNIITDRLHFDTPNKLVDGLEKDMATVMRSVSRDPTMAYIDSDRVISAIQRNRQDLSRAIEQLSTDPSVSDAIKTMARIGETNRGGAVLPLMLRADNPAVIRFNNSKGFFGTSDTARRAIEEGSDFLVLRNQAQRPGLFENPQFLFTRPEQARSIFARFDPNNFNSSNLLGSLAAVGAGSAGFGLLSDQADNRRRRRRRSNGT